MAVFSASIYPPNDLWDYATRVYARGRAGEACLSLQDTRGVDVNVLLFCCWVASSGRGVFREGELEHALTAIGPWRNGVIDVLHDLKVRLKSDVSPAPKTLADDLRRVIVESELHAEHAEVLMLHAAMTRPGTGTFDRNRQIEDSIVNLFRYLALLRISPGDDDIRSLIDILCGACPEEQPSRIESLTAGMAFRWRAGDRALIGG